MDAVPQQSLVEGNRNDGGATVLHNERQLSPFRIGEELAATLTQILGSEYVQVSM